MKSSDEPVAKRPYRMRARAAAAEQTRQRVLQATIELYTERWLAEFSLADVATRAGVTVPTVLRRFGSKSGLVEAAGDEMYRRAGAQRALAPVGDVKGAVHNLLDHYEEVGDLALRSLAQEGLHPSIRPLTERGRRLHQDWVALTFAALLSEVSGSECARLRAQLIAITDVYVWKLLRRDLGLERAQVELALREMIDGLQPKSAPSRD